MDTLERQRISPSRLRIGVVLLMLWWIPFWLVEPLFSALLGINSAASKHQLFIAVIVVQTLLGIAGLAIAGKQVALIVRRTSYRQAPKRVWRILRSGRIDAIPR